ncbi:alpha-tectorin-like [Centroberyx affinis]|uniref:alpha-tectorin-like n=1 Tax=Centroberyx affinis TaxID=166261 RepID=UPI003A5C1657
MLHFLLYQAVLSLLAGAAVQAETFGADADEQVDISGCPITFYGQTYSTLYVNHDSENQIIDVCFDADAEECVSMPSGTIDTIEVTVVNTELALGSALHTDLPQIVTAGSCHISVTVKSGSTLFITMEIHDFGTQAALRVKTESVYADSAGVNANLDVRSGDNVDNSYPINPSAVAVDDYFDLTGCSDSVTSYEVGGTAEQSATCSLQTCDATGVFTDDFSCGSAAWCQGNNECYPAPTMCTVTGSTVIDFHGNDQTVTHRCAYTLLSVVSTPDPDVDVVAVFQERRRTDVPLLSHVLLVLKDDGVTVTLEQGRVKVGDEVQTLSDTPQTVHGVELSKDQTGVTAKIPYYGQMIPVFFDGVTVQIDITGHTDYAPGGLCGDPTDSDAATVDMSTVKDSDNSDDDCETVQSDTTDDEIDCDAMTAKCNLLMQEPFTTCNTHIPPGPYISACTNILCNYPAGDDLLCQLLEAYATTCSSHSGDTLDGWRATAGCSATPTAFCLDTYCSSDEFCGEKGDNNVCLCRAIFASEYSLDSISSAPVCGDSSASLSLPRCVLEENNIDYTNLHLNDDSCTGDLDDDTHMVTFSFSGDTCGTVVTTSESQLLFKNAISIISTDDGTITRNDDVQIDLSCYYTVPLPETSMDIGIRIRDSSVSEVIESGEWTYTLTMNAYSDSDRTQAITSSTEINLDQTIWVELSTVGLDGNVVTVMIDSCWATNTALSSGTPRYDLITSGCANTADGTVVVGNGVGTSSYFSFNMFQFSGQTTDVYLHCQLKLCTLDDADCLPDCNAGRRRRRSLVSNSEDMSPALITMAWTK